MQQQNEENKPSEAWKEPKRWKKTSTRVSEKFADKWFTVFSRRGLEEALFARKYSSQQMENITTLFYYYEKKLKL